MEQLMNFNPNMHLQSCICNPMKQGSVMCLLSREYWMALINMKYGPYLGLNLDLGIQGGLDFYSDHNIITFHYRNVA